MKNQQHLVLLQRSIDDWNEWRGNHSQILPDLNGADLNGADLSFAHLSGADLSGADLSGADLSRADLSRATLVRTNLTQANLTGCQIYGLSAWDLQLEEAKQNNLVITLEGQPTITVDNLEVAQFIY